MCLETIISDIALSASDSTFKSLDDSRATIIERVRKANQRRRERILSPDEVWRFVMESYSNLSNNEWDFMDGGSVYASYNYRSYSTAVMMARLDDVLYVDIRYGSANSISPGRIWDTLRNLKTSGALLTDLKLREWARTSIGILLP
jgi:hypothetical protein